MKSRSSSGILGSFLSYVLRMGCGLPVPRAPFRTVDLERHPVGGGARLDQLERQVRAGVGEQPPALADDHGKGDQGHLVDEVVVEQQSDQAEAADHLQLAPRLGFKLADGGRDIPGENGRVRPLRVGKRGRCHVFGPGVQRRRDRVVALICPPGAGSPGAGEGLVGPPAEQEGVGALVDLACQGRGLAIEVRHGPSAALEPAAAVLLRPAEPLHHAVDGDVRVRRQFHGSFPFSLVWSSFGWTGPHRSHRSWHGPCCNRSGKSGFGLPYWVKKPSARLTCHMWPSGSANAPTYPHFWFPASMTSSAPASWALRISLSTSASVASPITIRHSCAPLGDRLRSPITQPKPLLGISISRRPLLISNRRGSGMPSSAGSPIVANPRAV